MSLFILVFEKDKKEAKISVYYHLRKKSCSNYA